MKVISKWSTGSGTTFPVRSDLSVAQSWESGKLANQKAKLYFRLSVSQGRKAHSDLKQSILDLTKAIESGTKTFECYWERGMALLNLKKPVSALRDFTCAVKLKPDEVSGYFWCGQCYMDMKKWGPAIRDFKRCVKIDPEWTENVPRIALGKAYYSADKYHLAIREFRYALSAPWPPSDKTYNISRVYRMMDRVYKKWGKPKEALWCFEKACSLRSRRVKTPAAKSQN